VQRGVLIRRGVGPRSSWWDTLIIGLDWPRTVASETTQCRCVVQPAAPVDRVPSRRPYLSVIDLMTARAFSKAPSLGSEVMVGWDGSRETTRAVRDALPFMQHAKKTTGVTVNGRKDEPADRRPAGADIQHRTADGLQLSGAVSKKAP
jgi:hypothetical protein